MPFLLEEETVFVRRIDAFASHPAKRVLEASLIAAREDMDHYRNRLHVTDHCADYFFEIRNMFQNVVRKQQVKPCLSQVVTVRVMEGAMREPALRVLNGNRAHVRSADLP